MSINLFANVWWNLFTTYERKRQHCRRQTSTRLAVHWPLRRLMYGQSSLSPLNVPFLSASILSNHITIEIKRPDNVSISNVLKFSLREISSSCMLPQRLPLVTNGQAQAVFPNLWGGRFFHILYHFSCTILGNSFFLSPAVVYLLGQLLFLPQPSFTRLRLWSFKHNLFKVCS